MSSGILCVFLSDSFSSAASSSAFLAASSSAFLLASSSAAFLAASSSAAFLAASSSAFLLASASAAFLSTSLRSSSWRILACSLSFWIRSSSLAFCFAIASSWSFCFASHFWRISSIIIWPFAKISSSRSFIASSSILIPLATATPCARASSNVAPVTTCLIADVCSSGVSTDASGSSSLYIGVSSTAAVASGTTSSGTTSACAASSGISNSSCIGTGSGGISCTCASSILCTVLSCTSSSEPSSYSFSSSTSSNVDSVCFTGSGCFFTAPGRLSYFSCWSGVSGLYFILSSIARYTYFPSLNQRIRSSHSSRHSAVIPASSYNLASSYAHFSIYSAFLNSSNAAIWSESAAPWVLRILYFRIYWFGSFGASLTNSS